MKQHGAGIQALRAAPALVLASSGYLLLLLASKAAAASGLLGLLFDTGYNCPADSPVGALGAGGAGFGAGGGEDPYQRQARQTWDEYERRRSSRDPADPTADSSWGDAVDHIRSCWNQPSRWEEYGGDQHAPPPPPSSGPWETITRAVDDYFKSLGGARD